MLISPQKHREIVFQLLYSADFESGNEVFEMLASQLAVTKKVMRGAVIMKEKVLEKKTFLDQQIEEFSKSYDFGRIPKVERNILRLGIYELLFFPEVPKKVAIAEAIRLTRKFATPEAATFVNAVMDAIYTKSSK